jgi:hypothetical protein
MYMYIFVCEMAVCLYQVIMLMKFFVFNLKMYLSLYPNYFMKQRCKVPGKNLNVSMYNACISRMYFLFLKAMRISNFFQFLN